MAGAADGFEIAVRALIGQQVSVKAARSLAGNLVMAAGRPLERPNGSVTHTFPTPAALAELAEREPGAFPMPEARRVALGAVAGAVASGDLVIDPGVATADLEKRLLAIRGIGPGQRRTSHCGPSVTRTPSSQRIWACAARLPTSGKRATPCRWPP